MPFSLQAVLIYALKGLILYRTWRKFAVGQIAISSGFLSSRNFMTGSFSSLEIFLFPLSIALSQHLLLNDQYRRQKSNSLEIDVGSSLVHL
ncbi:hypothetical protein ACS0TY_021831 [Phlomoides rotata]